MENNKENRQSPVKEVVYFVKGTHCASCEILIEKRILEIEGVKSVEVKYAKEEILIEYTGNKPDIRTLNAIFKKDNYVFSENISKENGKEKGGLFFSTVIALVLIIGFIYLNKTGLGELISVNSSSSLPAFFALGLLAGVSSCAALVGGLVLSMSKQWLENYSDANATTYEKITPHIIFNSGRVISYGIFGAVLGLVGSKLQISYQFSSLLIFAVSLLMILMSLQMLGIKQFRKFQFTLPKSFTKYIADEKNFEGKYMPFFMGAATFFLPCGFTITAQGLALLSGSSIQGALIMAMFAIGTAPALMLIGFSAVKFLAKPRMANVFSKVAGLLVLFFALFNISSQMNVLGFTGFNNFSPADQTNKINAKQDDAPALVNGKQVIKMTASGSKDLPNYFKVKAGIPVRWEITGANSLGCNGAIVSANLFAGAISLTPGQVTVKEFTPKSPGKYRFSCTMGMISGIIEVTN